MRPGGIGIWSGELQGAEAGVSAQCAAEIEAMGFTALWVPGFQGQPPGPILTPMVAATEELAIATGILNVWEYAAEEVGELHANLAERSGGRFLLGLGISHEALVNTDEQPDRYRRPYSKMVAYLDELDAATEPVPHDEMLLAALGPKMLTLAAQRTVGAHPYLVPPEHTRIAREVMGDDGWLAPEQKILFDADPVSARATARQAMAMYLRLPNYVDNLLRLGYTEQDLAGGGSDLLVDAIVAWGDDDAVAARVQEHFDAGADHVCVQVIGGDRSEPPRAAWRHAARVFEIGR